MSGSRKQKRFAAQERKRRRQFAAEERRRALEDLAAGRAPREVAAGLGWCCETLRLWRKAAEGAGTMPQPKEPPPVARKKTSSAPTAPLPVGGAQAAPTDALQAIVPAAPAAATSLAPAAPLPNTSQLGRAEVEAILRYKQKHPSMGPAQIRAQLKRFHGWRVAVRAIARVLTEHGYKLEHRGSRPEGDEVPHRFEAPRRNALWQIDFAELFIGSERRQLLIIEDDFSRFVVGHRLVERPTSQVAVEVLAEAIRRHGKPEAVYTDRGGAFLAWGDRSSFGDFLEAEIIDHHVGRPYHPQGRGKVEAVIHSVRRDLWETTHFDSVEAAEKGLARFFHDYAPPPVGPAERADRKEERRRRAGASLRDSATRRGAEHYRRADMGIDGLTPADRFFGRWEEVRAEVEARARHRPLGADPRFTEERLPEDQVEVVRLMLIGDRLELRLLGHTCVLGTTRS